MIPTQGCTAVFHYAFRPLACRQNPNDGGFTVTLYPDDRLVFTIFAFPSTRLSTYTFRVPADTKLRYFALVDAAADWLCTVPLTLRETEAPLFSCFFGYDGHPPLIASDLPILAQRPCGDAAGRYARHLYCLFEDMAELLAPLGFRLSLDQFQWDQRRVQPLPEDLGFDTGSMAGVS